MKYDAILVKFEKGGMKNKTPNRWKRKEEYVMERQNRYKLK